MQSAYEGHIDVAQVMMAVPDINVNHVSVSTSHVVVGGYDEG